MKKVLLFAAMAAVVWSCSKPVYENESGDSVVTDMTKTKKFTFTLKGDFELYSSDMSGTRGYLTDESNQLTDLWVFDYMGDACVQSIHQVSTDDDWGQPVLSLAYGSHHVYFVASRGTEPTVDNDAKTITWTKPSDTFWTDYDVNVVSTSNGNRAVTLDRVVTKLKVTITDRVPTGIATMEVTPETWYCGVNYQTGEPTDARCSEARVINVPASYVGTTGQLALSIFGLSAADEWTTNLTLKAKDGSDGVIGSAVIVGAAFRANRTTEYSGSLFGSGGSMTVSLSTDWETAKTGTW